MKTSALSQAVNLTAIQTLQNGLSRDKHDRHAFIVAQVATIIALALCKTPPKGHGNPADWKNLPETFKAAGLKAYSEHCAAFPQFLKETGQRSVNEWDTAYAMATNATVTAFGPCAPRTLTAEESAKRTEKREAKKAEKAKAEKAQAEEHRAQVKAERQQAFEEGRASVVVTAQAVADMVTSGMFSEDEVQTIGAAIMARVKAHKGAPVALPA